MMNYKRMLLAGSLLFGAFAMQTHAQSVEGTDYYLPKTMLRFTVKVEKTQYTPGQFAKYAMRYIRQNVSEDASTTYRLIGLEMDPVAVPDTAKHFTLQLDKKHSITDVTRAPNGQLLAINTEAQPLRPVVRRFTPAAKPKKVNPADFMTADILNASNTAKMAELTAQEIYDPESAGQRRGRLHA